MNREPLLSVGTVTSIVTAAFVLLVSFGLDISDDRQAAILGVIAVVVPLVAAVSARGKVTPVADPKTSEGLDLVPVIPPLGEDA